MKVRDCLIDKVSFVADIAADDLSNLINQITKKGYFINHENANDKVIFKALLYSSLDERHSLMKDDQSSVFIDYNPFKESRKLLVSYNPAKIAADKKEFLDEFILSKVKNKKITRIDIAFDTTANLLNSNLFHSFRKFKHIYEYKKLTYVFLGSEKAQKNICIYQKAADVQRLEFRLRGQFATDFINDELDLFKLIQIKSDFQINHLSGDELARIKMILDDYTKINHYSKNTKTKINRAIHSLKSVDITAFISEFWQEKKPSILMELKGILK